ncbi:uncharacterized protein Z520_08944 [Fonsecaea multimorphosa CBS 102226]|uniref:Malic acid transport protein n=1 Tax=Fonsecaea multimorphosa CBS 102226 TaxID=1442371 RepID=A0A0D2JQ10_9EURO|nr:uncharacterized protein Z520_08944 [Fonsecaea multimorphosa CBS 102226]KIX95427.1 hypothetical protein Z520_08944 [Fonsecaea multimorphosa CBS 102226]OAL20959.1 hypothetical protein AYO22_08379 [Fonsecaea multimorphosa]
MATGSLANVIYQTPYKFQGLVTVGKVIFIIDLIMFLSFVALITRRFIVARGSFRHSFIHYGEAFFVGTFWVSVSLIIQGADSYGHYAGCGPWLDTAVKICFWVYCGLTLLFAIFQYDLLFVTQRISIQGMTPAWILPMYPLIVAGPLAGEILQHQPPQPGIPIFVAGVTFQGLGWMVTIFLYAIWVIRLFSADLPAPSLRPGMYVAVGPTAYTAAGLVSLSQRATSILPVGFLGVKTVSAPEVLRVIGSIAGVFLWLLAFWYCAITTISVFNGIKTMSFTLTWWGFVFPNAGLALATTAVGKALDSPGIKWVSTAMTAILFVLWLFVAFAHARAVWKGQILWEGRDEDA